METRRSACDSCRRRRIRCDGSQPCAGCVRSGVTCTFGSTIHRQSATSYARSLEQQVAELQLQLQALHAANAPSAAASSINTNISSANNTHVSSPSLDTQSTEHSPCKSITDVVLRQENGTKFFRYSAGLNLLRMVANMLESERDDDVPETNHPGYQLLEIFEKPVGLPSRTPLDWLSAVLPSEEYILTTTARALDVALIWHDCVNRQLFRSRLAALFQAGGRPPSPEDRPFLALVYALLALGELWGETALGDGVPLRPGVNGALDSLRGLHFLEASRCIIYEAKEDLNLESIQAMMAQSRYLLTVFSFSAGHAALMPAIAAAMQMGLHNDDATLDNTFSVQERDDRRRTFAALHMVETNAAFHLGLPRTLRYASPKQCVGLNEEDMADGGKSLIARDPNTPRAMTILAQKLNIIYGRMHDHEHDGSAATFGSWDWISSVSSDLREWEADFPTQLPESISPAIILGQMGLTLQYAGIQVLLYAPCLHYLGKDRSDPSFSLRGYEYASSCIRAAMQSVFAMQTMQKYGILTSVNWLNPYMLAWSATVLTYFVLHSRTRATISETREAALMAKAMLESLGQRDEVARKIRDCLAPYVDLASATE